MAGSLTTEEVRSLADKVLQMAETLGVCVSVCIVDGSGYELMTIRGDGAAWFTPGVARAKAKTAAVMGRDTSDVVVLAERFPSLLPLISQQVPFEIARLPGGIVGRGKESCWAVGVSGALPELDEKCARAALAN